MDERTRPARRDLHNPHEFVPSDIYGAALTTHLARHAVVPGSSLKGMLRGLVEFLENIAPDLEIKKTRSNTRRPGTMTWLVREPELFDWAVETLARTAATADEAVVARRKSLREMAKIERRISRTQADTARLLARLVERRAARA